MGEELGFVGVVSILMAYYILVRRAFAVGRQAIKLDRVFAWACSRRCGNLDWCAGTVQWWCCHGPVADEGAYSAFDELWRLITARYNSGSCIVTAY